MTRVQLAVLAYGLGIAAAVLAEPAVSAPPTKGGASGDPRTRIVGPLPVTIASPGSHDLGANLTGVAGAHGIAIAASDVAPLRGREPERGRPAGSTSLRSRAPARRRRPPVTRAAPSDLTSPARPAGDGSARRGRRRIEDSQVQV